MKNATLLLFAFVLSFPLAFANAGNKKQDAPSAEDNDKRNTTVFETEASATEIHDAAVLALSKIGCKIKKDKADYVEGKRPNKVGLAVGSGGEKLFVWIEETDNGPTKVTVKTKKTPMGIVGQKLWNEEVAEDIQTTLSQS